MLDQEIEQRGFGLVHKLTVRIAPFAVFLVEESVRFPADHSVFIQRHPAALAVQLSRGSQQGIDGYVVFPAQQLQRFRIRLGFPGLPPADRLPGYQDPFRQFLLGQVMLFPKAFQHFSDFHRMKTSLSSVFTCIINPGRNLRKQLSVAWRTLILT